MAYVTDTPSRRLDSYIILTLADVGRHPDSLLFHMSADGRPGRHAPTHQCMHIPYCVGEADQLYVCHDPSHGGFYMAEGAFYIRIGLPPRVVSGDYLALPRYGLIDRYLPFFARACSMSDVR